MPLRYGQFARKAQEAARPRRHSWVFTSLLLSCRTREHKHSTVFAPPTDECYLDTFLQGNVEYVAVRAGKDECATPAKLVQNYVVCQLDKKMDILLGFIKTHLKSKMIVFFTSCAQVCS